MVILKRIADDWPVVKGDYTSGNPESRVAVVTLASSINPYPEAAIWGTCKTENLGAEKLVANIVSNSNIRYVLLCGGESRGHLSGHTLLKLHQNGIDEKGRIIGSEGAIPFIENIPRIAIHRFQKQVELIDCIGLTDLEKIKNIVDKYKNKGMFYNEEPILIISKSRKTRTLPQTPSGKGDMFISDEFVINTKTGLILETNSES
ncbi:MAG: tetrahydromethanopterin S-methyltransferase subunit A [Methanohalobium sp.]|uniref:tetrahydromethanopterin S-methyltransferase subunit A n=1 Tax=Methanohalobium sp. TaxID=2837493 RepID=UPI00397AC911